MNYRFFLYTAIAAGLVSCSSKQKEYVTPVIAPVTELVFATGHLEAARQFSLNAFNDGYINRIHVREGDIVDEGAVLVELDNGTAGIQAQTAEKNLAITVQQTGPGSATIKQLQTELMIAKEAVSYGEQQLGRMKRLYASNSVARTDLDNAQISYDNAVAKVRSIEESIRSSQLLQQQQLLTSKSQHEASIISNSYYQLKSPGRYKVYTLLKQPGDFVKKAEPVAIVGSADTLVVILQVDESGINRVKPGQTVWVTLNTEKHRTYKCVVTRVYPMFDEHTQSYKAELHFVDKASGMLNGTLLQANVVTAKKDRAMLLPRSCLLPGNNVLVKRGRATDTTTITTGIISDEWVEVLAGLQVNSEIVQQP